MPYRNLFIGLFVFIVCAVALLFALKDEDKGRGYYSYEFRSYIESPQAYSHLKYQNYVPLPYKPSEWEELYDLDPDGIVRVYREKEDKLFYNTVTIAQYALSNFKMYEDTGEAQYRDRFVQNAKYLMEHYEDRKNLGYAYPYGFDFPKYKLTPSWYSAMAQGQVLSVLAYYYKISPDPKILNHLVQTKNFMLTPISDGGTMAVISGGGLWLEEYAKNPPPFVLNGAVFAITGLYDYLSVNPGDVDAQDKFQIIIATLKERIAHYDSGEWLYYDGISQEDVSVRYMEFQTLQMYQLYQLTQDVFFLDLYNKWLQYYLRSIPDDQV